MLSAWLVETIFTELLLGDNWLRERIKAPRLDIKAGPDRAWRGLYDDNGSSLDIIGAKGTTQQRDIQVISISPLAVSDGHTFVSARLSGDCLRTLRAHRKSFHEHNLHSIITVRAFTIRYSTHGPPSQKLQLILDDVDWKHSSKDKLGLLGDPQPILSRDHVHAALKRLQATRDAQELEKRTRLTPDTMAGPTIHDEEGDTAGASMLESQIPFGTQAAHANSLSRPRSLGLRSTADARQDRSLVRPASPRRAGPITDSRDLLNLLRRPNAPAARPSPPASPSPSHPLPNGNVSDRKQPSPRDEPTSMNISHQISELSVQDDAQAGAAQENPMQSDEPDIWACNADWLSGYDLSYAACEIPREQQLILDRPESWAKPPPPYRHPPGNIPVRILKMLLENSRMRHEPADDQGTHYRGEDGMRPDSGEEGPSCRSSAADPQEFNEEVGVEPATSVMSWSRSPTPEPPKQQGRLENGLPPDSSLPAASAGSSTETNAQLNHPSAVRIEESSSGENKGVPSSANQHRKDKEDSGDDDDDDMEISVPHALGEDDEMPAIGPYPRSVVKPPATVPRRSSPKPTVQVKETPYPKQKGRDPIASTDQQTSSGSSKDTNATSIVYGTYNEPKSSMEQPHTTRAASENGIVVAEFPEQPQKPQNILNDGDVVMEDVDTASDNLQGCPNPLRRKRQAFTEIDEEFVDLVAEAAPRSFQAPLENLDEEAGFLLPSSPPATASISKAGPAPSTPSKTLLAAGAHTSKRKPDDSPRRIDPRKSKRREIKIIGFGGGSELQGDPLVTYKQEKEEFLRQDRVRRLESADSESANGSRAGSSRASPLITEASRTPAKVTEANFILEPKVEDAAPNQHPTKGSEIRADRIQTLDRKASNSPARVETYRSALLGPGVQVGQPEAANKTTSVEEQAHHQDEGIEEVQATTFSDTSSQDAQNLMSHHAASQDSSRSNSPSQELDIRKKDETHAPNDHHPILQQHAPEPKHKKAQNPVQATDSDPRHLKTVFDKFKAVYPDYTGDRAHFLGQCRQIHELDEEDKMVPRYMWDDYIIRNRTDFKDYAMSCIQSGLDPEPYHRFYKNRVTTILHDQGIVKNTATLLMAIEELGRPSRLSVRPVQSEQARRSLPWQKGSAPGTPTTSSSRLMREHPRHSLPDISQQHQRSPALAPRQENVKQTKTANLPGNSDSTSTRKSLSSSISSSSKPPTTTTKSRTSFEQVAPHQVRDTPKESTTGNKFRDFVKGQQKMAAHTGQTSVSSSSNSSPLPVRSSKPVGNAESKLAQ
ncbi:hypothetical protein BDV96DRAFT_200897 [Lophiotrema nucula]|uniref:Telomere replication protein EST3 n=1 Tax=Lophiotrema nucula TaxID=690887 RepID=A0A6A5YUZ3_9PLEO|nr:hypothetical protein BDV96DRAFT_200897 [Lophiotrema nucula]